MPYRCRDCQKYFSLKTKTVMEQSNLPLRLWGWAIYLELTNPKGVSSMRLHRDLGIRQATAWFMLHRIREAFSQGKTMFRGPVEVDETYVGGLEKNKHHDKKLRVGGGTTGKTAVVGMKDRATNRVVARVVKRTDKRTLQNFVDEHAAPGVMIYTDGMTPYRSMDRPHESVCHSRGEYVRGDVHTNGIESFWSMLKRAHKGIYHKMSPKHLQRYVVAFIARQNIREMGTLEQMAYVVNGFFGRRLTYRELVA